MLRKATFVPETGRIDTIFKDMQSEKIHMKIVVDEYGQTAGLITMEDILEEIVGNIFDEYDEEENNIILNEDGSFLVNGRTLLEEIEEKLGIDYEDSDYDTLNGYLIAHIDRIPEEQERLEVNVDGVLYKILGTENKMISQVNIILTGKK
jgi:putative hemolysin